MAKPRRDLFAAPTVTTPAADLDLPADSTTSLTDGLIFDYTTLDENVRPAVIRAVRMARRSKTSLGSALLELGRQVTTIKELVEHGTFEEIVKQDIGLSPRSAQSLMNVAEVYSNRIHELDLFSDTSQLFRLAAPSTPDTARDRAAELAQAAQATGQPITRAAVNAVITEEREKAGISTPALEAAARKSRGGGKSSSPPAVTTTTTTQPAADYSGAHNLVSPEPTYSENKSDGESGDRLPDPIDLERAVTLLSALDELLNDYAAYANDPAGANSARQALLPISRYYTAKARAAR